MRWKISCVELFGTTVTVLRLSPTIETNGGTVIGLFSLYDPERTLMVVPDCAMDTALAIVSFALSIDVPLLSLLPSFAT